jgi:hypothetical protein
MSLTEMLSDYVYVWQENLGPPVFLAPQTANVNGYEFHAVYLPSALAD